MSILSSFKLIAAKRPAQLSPVIQRRNKVIKRLDEQILLASAMLNGNQYAPTKVKTIVDNETGETTLSNVPKRIKAWYFTTENGKLCVNVRYGAKVVEIAKGKNAIELDKAEDLVITLESLKQAINNGEFDLQFEAISKPNKSVSKK